ncbi:hypothetical protein JCM16303_002037 [Sporobolomyces ruberrimus]
MSAAPLLHLSASTSSVRSTSPLRAIRRLRLITSHLSSTASTPSLSPWTLTSQGPVPLSRLGSKQFSTSSTQRNGPPSNDSRSPFTFTTACSFRGKPGSPIYVKPGSTPSSSSSKDQPPNDNDPKDRRSNGGKRRNNSSGGGFGHLKQGLSQDHPLSKWRDEQLEKSPNGAGHDWFFVQGVPNNGVGEKEEVQKKEEGEEKEQVTIGGIKGVVLGVADGVGGWEESGVDPSHFSQALMWFARERVRTGQFELERGGKGLKTLLEGAFEDVTNEKQILAGSSTACLVALDSATGKLHSANLGDSSFLILRPQPLSPRQEPTPPSSPDTPTSSLPSSPDTPPPSPSYKVLHSEPCQTHFFNAPYQLSKLPPSSNRSSENSLMDLPSDAATTPKEGIQLKSGDVVVLSTDGFGDNVFGEEVEQLLQLVHQKCLETQTQQQQQQQGGGGEEAVEKVDEHLFSSSLAQTSLNFSRLVMFKKDKVTPFEVEARRYGYGKESGLGGGKIDDVTVLVAVVGGGPGGGGN